MGRRSTPETVKTVEEGEEKVRALGFRQFRVRFHGELVRIEIAKDELAKALTPEMAQAFTAIFKALGFHYVTIDLEGYRQGRSIQCCTSSRSAYCLLVLSSTFLRKSENSLLRLLQFVELFLLSHRLFVSSGIAVSGHQSSVRRFHGRRKLDRMFEQFNGIVELFSLVVKLGKCD